MTGQRPNWFAADLDEIPPRVLAELEAVRVERGRPLVAVDADEVLVHFAEHFGEWLGARGYGFRLAEYKLDSAIRGKDGAPIRHDEIFPLVWSFIEGETRRQREIEGAAAALSRLSEVAQVVVLTNAPAQVREDRVRNLADLGMEYPVVMNEGGKGRALRWLADRAAAPTAFIDDNAGQLGSVARHATHATRLHLVGSSLLRPIVGPAETADLHPGDWEEAETLIRAALIAG